MSLRRDLLRLDDSRLNTDGANATFASCIVENLLNPLAFLLRWESFDQCVGAPITGRRACDAAEANQQPNGDVGHFRTYVALAQ